MLVINVLPRTLAVNLLGDVFISVKKVTSINFKDFCLPSKAKKFYNKQ